MGELVEKAAAFPTHFHDRRLDIFWKYQLPEGKTSSKKVEVIKDGANAFVEFLGLYRLFKRQEMIVKYYAD